MGTKQTNPTSLEVKNLLNDPYEKDGYLYGWVSDFSGFEENYRILTGVNYVTRSL